MKTLELKQSDGKPLMKSFKNTLKYWIDRGSLLEEYSDKEEDKLTAFNRFSGKHALVHPLFRQCLTIILNVSDGYTICPQSHYDNLRYAMLSAFPNDYYDFID
jgi:hypothetical protein